MCIFRYDHKTYRQVKNQVRWINSHCWFIYLFSSSNAEQILYQRQLSVEEKSNCSLTRIMTYTTGPMIGRNTYGYVGNKPFWVVQAPEAGEQVPWVAVQWRGWWTHPFLNNNTRTKCFIIPLSSPSEEHLPEEHRTPRTFQESTPGDTDYIVKRSPIPSSDANSQRIPSRSTLNGVIKNTPNK